MSKPTTKELAEKAIEKLQEAISYYDEIEHLAIEHRMQLQEASYDES